MRKTPVPAKMEENDRFRPESAVLPGGWGSDKISIIKPKEKIHMQMTGAEKAKNLKIAYIGGGSRGWAWGFMKDLAMDGDMCGTIRLYDIDRSAAERNRIIGGKISAHPKAVSRWEYEVSDTLREALTGVDFVVISILREK